MKSPRKSPTTRPQSPGGTRDLPPLPHERDQRTNGAPDRDPSMIVAADDLAQGRVDTECRSSTPAPACAGDKPSRPATTRSRR